MHHKREPFFPTTTKTLFKSTLKITCNSITTSTRYNMLPGWFFLLKFLLFFFLQLIDKTNEIFDIEFKRNNKKKIYTMQQLQRSKLKERV